MAAGHGEKLTRKQEQSIAALLTEATVEAAAAKAGVSYAALKNWLGQPVFEQAYKAARQSVLDRTVVRLLDANGKAVSTLVALLDGDHAPTKARSAVAILELALKLRDALDLEARVVALEEAARQAK